MAVRVEAIGAQGVPPTLMAFNVMLDEEHLANLLTSAASMPSGGRSVPRHLQEALTVLLATSTAEEPPSPEAATPTAGSSDGGAAPTPPASTSSNSDPVEPPALDVPLPL